jgi:glycosyltransferase involved in cell wall biosynthesis
MAYLSIVTPCYNEEANVVDLYEQVKRVVEAMPGYTYEHLFIDNASTDATVARLRELVVRDNRVRVIVNARNFGHIRSPYYALMQAEGDAAILIAADLQDPPPVIAEFVKKWEEGHLVVAGIKTQSHEARLMYAIRTLYYRLVARLANMSLLEHFTGFGLYDKHAIEVLRSVDDPYPYLRGLVSELGLDVATVQFTQPRRKRGKTSNNFYTLYDMAMLGITSHSKVPLRIASMGGFFASALSALVGFGYLVGKLLFWNKFELGLAPAVVGLFLMSSALLFFIGVLGEYVSTIHGHVRRLPLVVERERINFAPDRRSSLVRPCAPPPPERAAPPPSERTAPEPLKWRAGAQR